MMGEPNEVRWFGPDPWCKLCEQSPDLFVDTPVGQTCQYCGGGIAEADPGLIDSSGAFLHAECFCRGIFGSVAHQMRLCHCHGGTEEDPPGMTKRAAALMAQQLFNRFKGQEIPYLNTYVIYEHPEDEPDHVVIRVQRVVAGLVIPGPLVVRVDTVDQARCWIKENHPDLTVIPRSPDDLLSIVETWI